MAEYVITVNFFVESPSPVSAAAIVEDALTERIGISSEVTEVNVYKESTHLLADGVTECGRDTTWPVDRDSIPGRVEDVDCKACLHATQELNLEPKQQAWLVTL